MFAHRRNMICEHGSEARANVNDLVSIYSSKAAWSIYGKRKLKSNNLKVKSNSNKKDDDASDTDKQASMTSKSKKTEQTENMTKKKKSKGRSSSKNKKKSKKKSDTPEQGSPRSSYATSVTSSQQTVELRSKASSASTKRLIKGKGRDPTATKMLLRSRPRRPIRHPHQD